MAKPVAESIPKDGMRWPVFLIAAALMIKTEQGDLGCRCLQSYRIAPSPEVAQEWFLEQARGQLKTFMVVDLTVMELPLQALQTAFGIALSAKQEHPV